MDSLLNSFVRRPVLGPPGFLHQGWLACVDHIPRCMLRSEEKVTRAATSQQSAGQRDAVSGEVMWPTGDIDVGGACGVWCSSLLSRVYSTPSQLAFRGQVVVLFVDSSFRRMQSSTPPQVTTSCKSWKVRAIYLCSPQWWRPDPSTTERIASHPSTCTGHTFTSLVRHLRGAF